MKPRRSRWIWLLGLVAVAVIVLLLFWLSTRAEPPLVPVTWKSHPDFFPLGTLLQGSTVEMSVGLRNDLKPDPPPAWIGRLPQPLRRWSATAMSRQRAVASRHAWKIKVEAPDFLRVDQAEIDYDPFRGSFPTVHLRLMTDRPGNFDAPLTIRLVGRGHGTNVVLIPVTARVLAQPSRYSVLVTETPFERYATGDGRVFEPLATVITRLAERGVRVDFRFRLPPSFEGWNAILVGGTSLVELDAAAMERLRQFVARGGRLIVSADAFYVGTPDKANELLKPYGLSIDTKDAGQRMEVPNIAPDALTTGVAALSFWRSAAIWIADSSQAKVLAPRNEGDASGFIVVSRAPDRGDVILLAQSLWWNWVNPTPGVAHDNARMLENLLAP
jgi:hypothetical protein